MAMVTQVLAPGGDLDRDPAIGRAAELIKDGLVVAVPTETVYGLAGNAADASAVQRIFEAKNRPADNPLIVHLHSLEMVYRYCVAVDPGVEKLARAFWPGPLTLVLKAGELLRNTVCRGLDTVAVRIPDHPIIQALIARVDCGLAAPSANLSGKPSPTTADAVFQDLQGRISLILDGGPCRVGLESTVLDMSSDRPVILRPGMITPPPLAEVLGREVVYAKDEESRKRSPGSRYRHYSPDAKVLLLATDVTDTCRLQLIDALARLGKTAYIGCKVRPHSHVLHHSETPQTLPANLYRNLRAMDAAEVKTVVIDGVVEENEGVVLMDRLAKAASHFFHSDAEVIAHIGQMAEK